MLGFINIEVISIGALKLYVELQSIAKRSPLTALYRGLIMSTEGRNGGVSSRQPPAWMD